LHSLGPLWSSLNPQILFFCHISNTPTLIELATFFHFSSIPLFHDIVLDLWPSSVLCTLRSTWFLTVYTMVCTRMMWRASIKCLLFGLMSGDSNSVDQEIIRPSGYLILTMCSEILYLAQIPSLYKIISGNVCPSLLQFP
jgi:hypothetical protein